MPWFASKQSKCFIDQIKQISFFKGTIKTLSNIYDEDFCKNS